MTFQLMMQCAKMIPYLVVTCVLGQYAKGGPITWQRKLLVMDCVIKSLVKPFEFASS